MDAELARKFAELEARLEKFIEVVNACRVEYRDDNKMKAMVGFPFMAVVLIMGFLLLHAHGML